ncbi:MAG: helix-turn-helix domain-containing protein [Candidatus Acinetobacter avistercoris]|nr:helix-turn-helix domain-containing protein [Candidatus Acinetobacter avistercoris]
MLPTDQSQSQSCIKNYIHLTKEEKDQIYTLLREGFSKRFIAGRLNRSPSTISREVTRNKARNGYFAKHAHKVALKRHHSNPKRIPSHIWRLLI